MPTNNGQGIWACGWQTLLILEDPVELRNAHCIDIVVLFAYNSAQQE